MGTEESENFNVDIELSSDGPIIRVNGIPIETSYASFDKAYQLARKLLHRIEYIETKHELELVANDLNTKIQHLWIEENGSFELSDEPKKKSYRIALSLLRVYPECRIEADVIKDTGIAQKTVNNQLIGNVKSVSDYFESCENGYTLSRLGIDWLKTEVIIQYVTE